MLIHAGAALPAAHAYHFPVEISAAGSFSELNAPSAPGGVSWRTAFLRSGHLQETERLPQTILNRRGEQPRRADPARSSRGDPHRVSHAGDPKPGMGVSPLGGSWVERARYVQARKVFGKLRRLVSAPWNENTAHIVAMTLSVLPRLQTTDDPLLKELRDRIAANLRWFAAKDLALVAWVYAALNLPDKTFYTAIAAHLLPVFNKLLPHDAAQAVWGFAIGVSEVRQSSPLVGEEALKCDEEARFLFRTIWRAFTGRQGLLAGLSQDDLVQAYQAGLAWGQEIPTAFGSRGVELLRRLFKALAIRGVKIKLTHSKQEDEVGQVLRALLKDAGREAGSCLFNDKQAWAWGYSPDFLLGIGDRSWAIDFNGDTWHQIQGAHPPRLRGKEALREMLFRRMGLEVVQISSSLWERCVTPQKQRELVEERLGMKVPCEQG